MEGLIDRIEVEVGLDIHSVLHDGGRMLIAMEIMLVPFGDPVGSPARHVSQDSAVVAPPVLRALEYIVMLLGEEGGTLDVEFSVSTPAMTALIESDIGHIA